LIVNKEWFSICLSIKLENDKIKIEHEEHRIAKTSKKKFTNLLYSPRRSFGMELDLLLLPTVIYIIKTNHYQKEKR
jgi:hypothetical protein